MQPSILFTIGILFLFTASQGQSVEALQQKLQKYERQVASLQDSINITQDQIKRKQLTSKARSFDEKANVSQNGVPINELPDVGSKSIGWVGVLDTVNIVDYVFGKNDDRFYKLKEGGFLRELYVTPSDNVKKIVALREKGFSAKKGKTDMDRLTKRYGATAAKRILNDEIWLGMKDEMLVEVLGNPSEVNRTVYTFGVHEQWIYNQRNKDLYFYFENGKLKSWQD